MGAPDDDTLAEWMADGVCRCPDDCLVVPEGWCEHGLASWTLISPHSHWKPPPPTGQEGRRDD
jgi:hypothetical protein